jgi:hypothetical protein
MLKENISYEKSPYNPCSNKLQRAPEHNPSPISEGFFFVSVRVN